MTMPNPVELTGKLPVYQLGLDVGREHFVTRHAFQRVFGDELVSLALEHYPRAIVSWEQALVKLRSALLRSMNHQIRTYSAVLWIS